MRRKATLSDRYWTPRRRLFQCPVTPAAEADENVAARGKRFSLTPRAKRIRNKCMCIHLTQNSSTHISGCESDDGIPALKQCSAENKWIFVFKVGFVVLFVFALHPFFPLTTDKSSFHMQFLFRKEIPETKTKRGKRRLCSILLFFALFPPCFAIKCLNQKLIYSPPPPHSSSICLLGWWDSGGSGSSLVEVLLGLFPSTILLLPGSLNKYSFPDDEMRNDTTQTQPRVADGNDVGGVWTELTLLSRPAVQCSAVQW